MNERIKIIDFKYKVTFWAFLFFLIISFLAPISGGDWNNYLVGKEGLINCIKNINLTNGNIIGSFLGPFLAYNKGLFNFIFALLMSLFIHLCNDMIGIVKDKKVYLLPFIGTLLVNTFIFSYNYVSVTATINYTFPAILSFYYFYVLWKKEKYEFYLKDYILLILIIFLISLSSIHIAISFLIGNIIFYLYALKRKNKFPKMYSILILINIILTLIPLYYLEKPFFYNDINISLTNLPKYIDTIFSKNILLILFAAIPINYYLFDKLKNFTYSRVIVTLFYGILIFSFCYNFFYYFPVNLNLVINKYFGVFATENWYYIFYFLIYMFLLSKTMKKYVQSKKIKEYFKIFSIMSLIVSLLLIVSPLWDEGSAIFVNFFLIAIVTLLFKEMDFNINYKILFSILIILICYYIAMFGIIKYIDVTKEEYIKEQLNVDEKIIEVKANPIYLVWRYNPVTIFQQKDFKRYYNIPQNKEIIVKYFGIFEKIEKRVKE